MAPEERLPVPFCLFHVPARRRCRRNVPRYRRAYEGKTQFSSTQAFVCVFHLFASGRIQARRPVQYPSTAETQNLNGLAAGSSQRYPAGQRWSHAPNGEVHSSKTFIKHQYAFVRDSSASALPCSTSRFYAPARHILGCRRKSTHGVLDRMRRRRYAITGQHLRNNARTDGGYNRNRRDPVDGTHVTKTNNGTR